MVVAALKCGFVEVSGVQVLKTRRPTCVCAYVCVALSASGQNGQNVNGH